MEPAPPAKPPPSSLSPRTEALVDERMQSSEKEEEALASLIAESLAFPEDASDVSSYEEARAHLQKARRTLKILQTAIERMSNSPLAEYLKSSRLATTSKPEILKADLNTASGNFDVSCTDAVLSTIQRATQSMFIGVDGSDNCDVALEVALALRKGEDEVHLVHVGNNDTKKWESMKGTYEAKLLSIMLPSKYSLKLLAKSGSIREAIVMEVNSSPSASMFVCGFIRAGLEHGASAEAETIGSHEDLSMRDIHVPSLIVKNRLQNPQERYFVLLTNGSEACWRGYLLTTVLMRPRDSIVVAHFYNQDQESLDSPLKVTNIKERYGRDMLDRGINGSFFAIPRDVANYGQNKFKVALEQISEFLKDHSPDFLVICPRPSIAADPEHYKKSLTESIINTINCNMIVCKSNT